MGLAGTDYGSSERESRKDNTAPARLAIRVGRV